MSTERFRSAAERQLYYDVFYEWEYEPYSVKYDVPVEKRSYTPDFVRTLNGKTVFIECKGYFRDMDEAKKYIHINNSLPEDTELVFLLMNRYNKMPYRAKVKKSGEKGRVQTIEEWLDKNGIRHFYSHEANDESIFG